MLRALVVSAMSFCLSPAFALELPVFDQPKALLEAIYDQYAAYDATDDYDPADYFDEEEAYSVSLKATLDAANERVWATGEEAGALDFSPLIDGQDTGQLTYRVNETKVKGARATGDVDIFLAGEPHKTIGFLLVDEGAGRGWKIDDILLPNGDSAGFWPLSEYLESLPSN